jgi:hypothetical protein
MERLGLGDHDSEALERDGLGMTPDRSTTDTAALLLISIIGLFVVGTMIALIVLAFSGATGGESVWAGLFSLMTAALGGVAGYLSGTQIQQQRQRRNGNGQDGGPEAVYRPPSA